MAEIIKMPKMSDTMEEGVIASWQKKVGDKVKSGDILAEVETDKATMELESYEDGILLYIGVEEKSSVPVDGVIAIIGEKGENIDDILKNIKEGSESPENSSNNNDTIEESKEESTEIDTSDIDATIITMPKMSDTMEEGTIAQWLKKVGDEVKSGDILAEVETDKATMELEAYDDGTLLYTAVKDGEAVAVDGIIAIIGDKNADYKSLLNAKSKKNSENKPEKATNPKSESKPKPVEEKTTEEKKEEPVATSQNGRIKASPLAKKLAEDKGFDIAQIPGSGEGGRIIKRDVEEYQPKQKSKPQEEDKSGQHIKLPTVISEEKYDEVQISQMRKTIAKRLADSKFTAPHFYVTMEINMDKAIEARKSMNEVSPVKISFNDMVIKASASALKQHPSINSSWLGDKIRTNHHINIGVAVAVEDGLLVPVIRYTDAKSLSHIASEVKELAGKAKNKKLQPSEWEGNTFTISNLGMFGVEEFTAIINPPDACILAVGGIKETPIVRNGELVVGNTMKVTLSCDHRVVDGASGAAFLQTLKGLLEDPVRILI